MRVRRNAVLTVALWRAVDAAGKLQAARVVAVWNEKGEPGMAERMVDLTLTLTDNMPAHKLFQRPVIVPHYTHAKTREQFFLGTEDDRLSFATTYMGMIDHIGTHVDAFYHVNPEGLSVDRMPLDMFMGKAVCWDLTYIPDLGDIDVADFEEAEEKGGVKVDGPYRAAQYRPPQPPLPRCEIGVEQPRHHRSSDPLARRQGLQDAWSRRPVDGQAVEQSLPQPPGLPRSRHRPL